VVTRILPPGFSAKARAEGPSGNRALQRKAIQWSPCRYPEPRIPRTFRVTGVPLAPAHGHVVGTPRRSRCTKASALSGLAQLHAEQGPDPLQSLEGILIEQKAEAERAYEH